MCCVIFVLNHGAVNSYTLKDYDLIYKIKGLKNDFQVKKTPVVLVLLKIFLILILFKVKDFKIKIHMFFKCIEEGVSSFAHLDIGKLDRQEELLVCVLCLL